MVDLGKILGAGAEVARLQEVVDFVVNRKDDLVVSANLARELPTLLRVLASGLADAGTHASNAGKALTGASGATGRIGDGTAAIASISTASPAISATCRTCSTPWASRSSASARRPRSSWPEARCVITDVVPSPPLV